MAYIIGNTTVINNAGNLGSVDGNSLNLANNSNIAGGGSFSSVRSSNGAFAVPSASIGLGIVSGGGQGGGAFSNNSTFGKGGDSGRLSYGWFNISNGGNASVSLGSGGNTNFQANAGNAGGNSSFTYSSNTVTQSNLNTINYGPGASRAGPPGQNGSGIGGGNIFANFRNARQAGSLGAGGGATRFTTQQGAGASGGSGAGIMIGF